MVGGNQQQVVLAQTRKEGGELHVKAVERLGVAAHIVAVAVQHIEIHQIDKAKPGKIRFHAGQQTVYAVVVVPGRIGGRHRAAGKNVADLADAGHGHPRLGDGVEQGTTRRLEREVVPARRAVKRTGFARERARDHAADGVLARQQGACRAAVAVERFDGDDSFMRRYLKHAVRRGVDDVFSGAHMLFTVIAYDFRARIGTVAEHAAPHGGRKGLQQRGREAVGKSRERARGHQPRQFPMAGGRVLAGGFFTQHRAAALRAAGKRAAQRRQGKQAGALQMRTAQEAAADQRVQRA